MRKILNMFGLGTIFSDIVRDNPTIKNTVGKCAFRHLISGLGCMRQFTHLHKMMCGCTECVGLNTLNCLLQAKRGVVQWQIAINLQHQLWKARADVMARGWGDVGLHMTPLDEIREGTCSCWAAHPMPHWECQTLQCSNCSDYPVPAEEAREDARAEDISFHVYKYKVSLCADGKEQQRIELAQKRMKIGAFHRLYYVPTLGRGQYHTMSYHLAPQYR